MIEFPFGLDALQIISEYRNEYLTGILLFFTFMGEDEGYILIITFIYLAYDKSLAVRLAILVLATMSANHLLKMLIGNPRPFVTEGTFMEKWLIPPEYAQELTTEFSTPSGHAMSSFAFYGYLYSTFKNSYFTAVAFLLILLIGFSRPYLGVHYVEDIALGWLFGLIVILLTIKYSNAISDFWIELSLTKQLAITIVFSLILWLITFYIQSGDIAIQPLPFVGHLGFIFGIVLGSYLEQKHLNFDPKSRLLGIKILRWVISIVLVMTPLLILEESSLINWSEPSYSTHLFQYIGYSLAGFIGIFLAPLVLLKLNLIDRVGV